MESFIPIIPPALIFCVPLIPGLRTIPHMMFPEQEERTCPSLKPGELRFILLFLLCTVFIPLIFGELFPFTPAPMFRDRPQVYCDYTVTDPDGGELPLKDFRLHRNYDGNPIGMGAGVKPSPTLARFDRTQSLDEVRSHVAQVLKETSSPFPFVNVRQRVVGSKDSSSVGVIRENTIKVFPNEP